jgi:hypothetical protein
VKKTILKKNQAPKSYFTTAELAARYGLHIGTIENWRQNGQGPRWIKVGDGHGAPVRYQIEDILSWEDSRKNGAK